MRIAFDLDGVFADFTEAFADVAARLGVPAAATSTTATAGVGREPERPLAPAPRQIDRVWREIRGCADFWTTLRPIDAGALRRLHTLAVARHWEVIFLTRRPVTAGQTVQRQTQHWLAAQGYELPSVITVRARGHLAAALDLDVVVDDCLDNCLDVLTDSRALAVWVARGEDTALRDRATSLGIGVVASVADCLDRLEELDDDRQRPTLLARLRSRLGLKAAAAAARDPRRGEP